jgi:hypothetical protein
MKLSLVKNGHRYSTLKVCNALSSLLSSIESGIEAANRIPGETKVVKDLETVRSKVQQELTLACLRHERINK